MRLWWSVLDSVGSGLPSFARCGKQRKNKKKGMKEKSRARAAKG